MLHIGIDFESVEITDEYFPEEEVNAAFVNQKYIWGFSFDFSVKKINKENFRITVSISHNVNETNAEKSIILKLHVATVFKITGVLSEIDKPEVIKCLAEIAQWITRGVYAAKTEGTIYSVLAAEVDTKKLEVQIKNVLKYEWN